MPLLFLSAAVGHSAGNTAVVYVDLMDPSTSPLIKSMTITTDARSVKAGRVTFEVSNDSKDLVHEMIVVSVADPKLLLPYDRKDNIVIESKIKAVGEVSDLKPGRERP